MSLTFLFSDLFDVDGAFEVCGALCSERITEDLDAFFAAELGRSKAKDGVDKVVQGTRKTFLPVSSHSVDGLDFSVSVKRHRREITADM